MNADDMGADAWADVLMTNVAGPFFVAKAFLPRVEAMGGKIAILSSVMASSAQAPGNGYIYRSSKAAATNVACNLAAELKPARCRSWFVSSWLGAHRYGRAIGCNQPAGKCCGPAEPL